MILLLILLPIHWLLVTLVELKGMLKAVFHCSYVVYCSFANVYDCHCWCLDSIGLNLDFHHVFKRMRFSVACKPDILVLQ